MKTWQAHKQDFENLVTVLTSSDPFGVNATIPKDIADWIAQLKLLYGVPFNYLAPDEKMLPVESIRFFYLDPGWVDCLVDGALSIGRSTAGDVAHDAALAGHVHTQAGQAMRQVRPALLGQAANLAENDPPPQHVTGFLLRSAVVKGWPGLEVRAFDDADPPAELTHILRMERLAPDILICLFEGVVKTLYVHEPCEMIHLGVTEPEEPATEYSKDLRYVVDCGKHKAGSQIDDSLPYSKVQSIPFRAGGTNNDTRVIQISKLASNIRDTLNPVYAKTNPFTSAEFALEMAEGVEQVCFQKES